MCNPLLMFDVPRTARDAAYVQPTLHHGLRIWWAYYWPTSLIAGLLTFCGTYWARIFYERAAISAHTLGIYTVCPYANGAAIGLLVFRYILGKRFRHFRVALLPAGKLEGPPRPAIWRRTIRVWWTFTWRSVVYGVILSSLLSVSLGMFLGMLRESNRFLAIFIPLVEQLIIAAGVGLFVIYSNVLDEEFGDFRVALLPREPAVPTAIAPDARPQTQATA